MTAARHGDPPYPACPLTGDRDVRRLERIAADTLVRLWRRDLGLDVAPLFAGVAEIGLYHTVRTDLVFFHPPVCGDGGFYTALRRFPWYSPVDKAEFRIAAALVVPGMRVLEAGAGAGHFRRHIPEAVWLPQEPFAADGVSEGDDTAPVDLACAFQVLEHVADPLGFAAGLADRLRPGGRLVLAVPDRDGYPGRLKALPLDAPPHHVTRWSAAALSMLAERIGLTVEAVHRPPVEPWEARAAWMARVESPLARLLGVGDGPEFGRNRRGVRVAGWIASGPLARRWPRPGGPGGVLVLVARKPGG